MSFQIQALAADSFEPLFAMSDNELAERLAVRSTVDAKPGYPCRVSLQDAELGEEVLLVHHTHQPAATPFRASHAIYVRRGAQQASPPADEVPQMLRSRLLSVRGFTDDGHMVSADVVAGTDLEGAIAAQFANGAVAYLHLHNARQGCYLARVERGAGTV